MSRAITVHVQLKVSWWFRLWLEGLTLVAFLAGREPDPQKVVAMAMRGIKTKVVADVKATDPQA